MRHRLIVAATLALLPAGSSQADITATFRYVETVYSPLLIYPGIVGDAWALQLTNHEAEPITVLEMHFMGDFLNQGGPGFTFRDSPANPIVLGFEALDTFFVVPNGTSLGDILSVAVQDDSTTLKAAFAIAGAPSLVDPGATETVAVFGVPHGTVLNRHNFVMGQAITAPGSEIIQISYVIPEPSAMLLAITTAAFACLIRRRG